MGVNMCVSTGDATVSDRLPDAGNTPGGQVMNSPLPAGTPYSASGRSSSVQLDANGNFPFYFLDAYENSEVRPGESYAGLSSYWLALSLHIQNLVMTARACVFCHGILGGL